MPSIVNGPAMTSTAVPTPARISPEQLKASHAAAAVQVDGAKDEAKVRLARPTAIASERADPWPTV